MKNLIPCALGFSAFVFVTSAAHAAILTPGTGILMAGNTQAGIPGTLVDTLTSSVAAGRISGTLESDVYVNDPTNTNGPTAYTFVYTLTNAAGSDALERVNFTDYAGFSTDVEYLVGTPPPSAATRSTLAQDGGDLVGFNFQDAFGSPSLPPGTAAVLIVHTNASADTVDIANVIDGSVAQVSALAPASGSGRTPEPASLGLLSIGGLLLLRRRK